MWFPDRLKQDTVNYKANYCWHIGFLTETGI